MVAKTSMNHQLCLSLLDLKKSLILFLKLVLESTEIIRFNGHLDDLIIAHPDRDKLQSFINTFRMKFFTNFNSPILNTHHICQLSKNRDEKNGTVLINILNLKLIEIIFQNSSIFISDILFAIEKQTLNEKFLY